MITQQTPPGAQCLVQTEGAATDSGRETPLSVT
jgi:hypothetical protein